MFIKSYQVQKMEKWLASGLRALLGKTRIVH